jgi:hypothetical protein
MELFGDLCGPFASITYRAAAVHRHRAVELGSRLDHLAFTKVHEGRQPSSPRRRLQMYGVVTTVPAPVEMYDAMHAQMVERVGTSVDGLLVHVGRATTDGFQVLEVWESKQHYDRANTDVVFPLMRELAGDQAQPSIEQAAETFDVRGLVIPAGNILI